MANKDLIKENARLQELVLIKDKEINELRTGRNSGGDYVLADWKYHELNNASNESLRNDVIISDLEVRLFEASKLVIEQGKSINKLIDKL